MLFQYNLDNKGDADGLALGSRMGYATDVVTANERRTILCTALFTDASYVGNHRLQHTIADRCPIGVAVQIVRADFTTDDTHAPTTAIIRAALKFIFLELGLKRDLEIDP